MRGSICATGISKSFAARNGNLAVLDSIDLSVSSGEFVALVGPSGCGKSTLLDILSGFQRADRGQVLIDGQVLDGPSPKRILIPQSSSVFPWMSVLRNMTFVQKGIPEHEKVQWATHYLEMVGLSDFTLAYPNELSGGMLQRLEVARALVGKPDILLMDEPFGSLDALTRLKLRNELLGVLSVEKHTVILVTHDVEEALHLADRIVIMTPSPGRVRRVIEVQLSHPRAVASIELVRLKREVQ
jgi:NitT/TauT family transport system ATP-binding protein/sulfonate transport system ATP-binding protein